MRKEKKTEIINMKVAPSVKKAAQEIAAKRDVTVSEYIASLISEDAQRESEIQTKFIVTKIVLGDPPAKEEVFDTQQEANEKAISMWGKLSDAEKRICRIYVTDVTEEDIDPSALEKYHEEGGVFPWTEYLYSGHTDGNFDSENTVLTVEKVGKIVTYTVRGKKISVDTSKRSLEKALAENPEKLSTDFVLKWIQEDIDTIEHEINDSLLFGEKNKIYEAMANYYG